VKSICAFSGGKDSTSLALRLADLGEDFELFFTPTSRELPECIEHIHRVRELTGKELVIRKAKLDLDELIADFEALPNQRMRWCTRMLKIEPAKAYLLEHPGSTLLVGLRADEEERAGLWGDYATYRYPLREWGWGIDQVYGYLDARGVTVPDRTDCDYCYEQRLSEWWKLWRNHPDRWAHAVSLEKLTGHTFRSAVRDTWPAALEDLGREFAAGKTPRGIIALPLFDDYDEPKRKCRVCSF
jgi:PP-loop superfamily ATP-utilizing enzyme